MGDTEDLVEALKRSEHRYRNIFQAMSVAFWELDFFPVGDILRDLRKQGVIDFAAHMATHPEVVRQMMRATRIVDINDQVMAMLGRGDRAEMLVNLEDYWPQSSTLVYAASVIAAVTGQPNYSTETRVRAMDGREVDVLFTACFPPDTMNKGTLLVGVIDISERLRAEAMLAQLQAEFAHAARISMLGELTASIAHEVNQPLAAIAASAAAGQRWLGRDEPDLEEVKTLVARIARDADRAAQIIGRVQLLLDRGLGAVGVAIDPGAPFGVLVHPTAVLTSLPVFTTWNAWNKAPPFTFKSFTTGFANTLPAGEMQAEYDAHIVPSPGRIFYDVVLGRGAKVHWKNPTRAPLLLIAAEHDRTVPTPMVRQNYAKQKQAGSATDFHLFYGRSHYLCNEAGWEDVADYCLDWAVAHLPAAAKPKLAAVA